MRLFIILLCIVISISAAPSAAKRATAVKGVLLCGTKPAENVRVRLFRVKQVKDDDLDQVLDEKFTAGQGMFHVEGNTNGFPLDQTDILPVISIYHTCDEDATKVAKNGYRKFSYIVPTDFVNLGAKAKKVFDVGTLNLQVEYPGEKHDKKVAPKKTTK